VGWDGQRSPCVRTDPESALPGIGAPENLELEHVFTRKWLIEQMLDEPSAVEVVLREFAIACTVTRVEHFSRVPNGPIQSYSVGRDTPPRVSRSSI
jgi:hypothetical protein